MFDESTIPNLPPLDEVIDLVPDAICVVDPNGQFLFVSAGFGRILGYSREEVLGRRSFDFIHPDDRAATLHQADLIMSGALQRHYRNRYMHKNGHIVDMQWSARWHAERGVRIAVGREVTELRRAEQDLEYLASHDALTGLPNRHYLQHELLRMLEHAQTTDTCLALLYVDLDGFKATNDHGGHEVGDRVLREVANRLKRDLRQNDLVARVGGDEFVVLLPDCRDAPAARKVADALRARLHPSFFVPNGEIHLDASVGIACFPTDACTADALLAHADRDMYAAKRQRPTD